jgi:hypothetical protein
MDVSDESLKRVNKWADEHALITNRTRVEIARLLDAVKLEEHKLTCSETLLQYDKKGKLIGHLRCGEGWNCERRTELERP